MNKYANRKTKAGSHSQRETLVINLMFIDLRWVAWAHIAINIGCFQRSTLRTLETVPYVTSVLDASKYDTTTRESDPDISRQLTLEVEKKRSLASAPTHLPVNGE